MLRADRSQPGRSDSATEPVAKNMSRTRSSLFHLNSRYRFGRSFGLAGLSAAARRFGSNGDRADWRWYRTGRSGQPWRNKLHWKLFRKHWNDWPRGTSEVKLLPECKADSGQRRTPDPRRQSTTAVVSAQIADEPLCRPNEARFFFGLFSLGNGNSKLFRAE